MTRSRARPALAILAAGLVGVGLSACGGGQETLGPPEATAITVGKESITNGQVDRRAQFIAVGNTPEGQEPPAKDSDDYVDIRRQAASQLLDERIFNILAGSCGKPCAVSKAAIDSQIVQIQQQEFAGSKPRFEERLAQLGITVDDLRLSIRSGQQEQRLTTRVSAGARTSEPEALAFYRTNIAQFKTPSERRGSHILVATEQAAASVRAQATAASFASLAKRLSTDPSAKENGGDLGVVPGTSLVPEVEAAFAKLKPGQISQPVKSQFGWHVLLLRQIPANTKTFAEVKAEILAQQLQTKQAAAVEKWRDNVVERQRKRAKYETKTLQPVEAAKPATTPSTSTPTATTTPGTTTTGSGPATP